MKKAFFLITLLYMGLQVQAAGLKPWTKGAFETRQYRNVFAEMGYSQADIDAKVQQVFYDVFRGPNKVYFEVGDSMGYVSDIKNNDARTEGMSYGLMVAVQFGEKDIFDRLWRWAKRYMQHQSGPREGYFAWSCKTDGTKNADGAASDGELYFISALIFASNRWGNDTGINYKAGLSAISRALGRVFSSIRRRNLSRSHPMASVSGSPIPAITSLLSTRCGLGGPTTAVRPSGMSVSSAVALTFIRPATM